MKLLKFKDPEFVQLAREAPEHAQGMQFVLAEKRIVQAGLPETERRLGLWLGEKDRMYLGATAPVEDSPLPADFEAFVRQEITIEWKRPDDLESQQVLWTEGAPDEAWSFSLINIGLVPGTTFYATFNLPAKALVHRFTHTSADGRFDPSRKELRAQSYFTSDHDQRLAPSGFAAVGRYALPSPLPAWYRHTYRLQSSVSVSLGTVRPLFGQAGGGTEGLLAAAVAVTRIGSPVRLPVI